MKTKTNLNYYASYFEALFWADIEENYDLPDSGRYCDFSNINSKHLETHFKELDLFFNLASEILDQSDYTHDQACHDFYFTRCGHGVGFWENDHCTKEQGEKLTYLADKFGTVDIMYNAENNEIELYTYANMEVIK